MILDRSLLMKLGLDLDKIVKMEPQEQKKTIKKAYHSMAQKYHPDIWEESIGVTREEGEQKFKDCHHAYKMMTDPTYRNKEGERKGQVSLHAVFNINLQFEQAYFGQTTIITFNPAHINSEGTIDPTFKLGEEKIEMDVEVVTVTVPPKTKMGDKVVIPGKGLKKGNERGDMIFIFAVNPHPSYNTDPHDDNCFVGEESVPLEVMLTGGVIEVETIWGLKSARIPAGSRPNEMVKVSGLGKDKLGAYKFKIVPHFPTKDKMKDNDIWKRLGIDWSKESTLDEQEATKEREFEKVFERLGGFTGASQSTGNFRWV